MTEPEASSLPERNRKDKRLESPFSPENYILDRDIPTIAGITDTHLQTGQKNKLGIEGISSGKGNLAGTGNFSVIRNMYRRISQMNTIALHKIREVLDKAVENAELLIQGGDVSDALTTHGLLGDIAYQEQYFVNRFRVAEPKEGFLGTIYMTGNHDTDFAGFDRAARYNDIQNRFTPVPLRVYKEIIGRLKIGERMSTIAYDFNTPYDRFALHPGLKWYLERVYFGQAIGAFVDTKKNEQVFFLDSEFNKSSGSVESLEGKLRKDLQLDKNDPKLFEEILSTREKDRVVQERLLFELFEFCESRKSVVFAHDPIRMQKDLIEYCQHARNVTIQEATQFVQKHIVVWGGHWHTNDDGSAKSWNKPGVHWWNGPSRIKTSVVSYIPVGENPLKQLKRPFLPNDSVAVLTGLATEPEIESVSGDAINKERNRLYSLLK